MAEQVVLGLDFGGSKIAVALGDRRGARLAEASVQTVPSEGARWNLELGIAAAQHLLRRDAGRLTLVAIGAATFGVPRHDRIELADAIPEWGSLALASELRRSLDCAAVRVVNNLEAAATAECHDGALRGCESALYLSLGERIAVGALASGAGDGPADGLGVSSAGARRRLFVGELVDSPVLCGAAQRVTGAAMSEGEILAAEAELPALAPAVGEFVEALAARLVRLAAKTGAQRIAVGGATGRAWARLEPALEAALARQQGHAPQLVLGAYLDDAALAGALLAGLEEAARVEQADRSGER